MYDVIIVGSGPSAVASALELSENDIKPLILDVGYTAQKRIENPKNLYEMKAEQICTDFLVGENFEYFANDKQNLPAKLKSPYFDFVTKTQPFFEVQQKNYNAITSYAKGGLANAWGSGLMRFSPDEFSGLPITLEDLVPYYDKLEKEIGVSGRNDDLSLFFGHLNHLQEPLNRSRKTLKIYSKYNKNKKLLNKKNIFLGTPRIGVSQNKFDVRDKCRYDNLEFWQPNHSSLYTPSMTLDKLISQDLVDYKNGVFIDRWEECEDTIKVIGFEVETKKEITFTTKKLILAAGTLNTSRIVLKSRNDYKTELNFLDNPAIQFPIFFPSFIGQKLETESFGLGQLNLFYKSELINNNVIGAIIEPSSLARTEFLDKFPFSFKSNIDCIKYMLPSMMAVQIFLPSDERLAGKLSLKKDGNIEIVGNELNVDDELIAEATNKLTNIGLLTHKSLAIKISHGNGIHYGGTLPMSNHPLTPYETTIDGELAENKNIYIVDGSTFKMIPATNYSLSVMANSMRITQKMVKTL